LDANEPRAQVEDEVVPLVGQRAVNADTELHRFQRHRGFGNSALSGSLSTLNTA
jgi:hypothetical protein